MTAHAERDPAHGGVVTALESPHERVRFATHDVLLGEFRCAPSEPGFCTAGKIRNYVVAFPRTAVWIDRESERAFVADPGVATIYSPGQAFERRAISGDGDCTDWFGIAEPVAREIVSEFSTSDAEQADAFRYARAPVGGALYLAQRRLFESLARNDRDDAEVEERALAIALAVLRSAYVAGRKTVPSSVGGRGRAKRDLAEGAKEVILATLFENLGVSEIAARLGVSTFHLCRVFRAVTHKTLHEYRKEIRLRFSLARTGRSRGSLSALAMDLGFYSHSHFTAAFREAFGEIPSRADGNAADVRALFASDEHLAIDHPAAAFQPHHAQEFAFGRR